MKNKTSKFQNDKRKAVEEVVGVAHTRYILNMFTNTEKLLSSANEKCGKNFSDDNSKLTCTATDHVKEVCKVSEWFMKNCRSS